MSTDRSISADAFAREPFRLFFPAGGLAGIIGVALWPIYFQGLSQFYPGTTHPRIMACGMFGGFIFGFLGTAMPRMLSAKPFRLPEVIALLLLHAVMVAAFAAGKVLVGDILFLMLLAAFFGCIAIRALERRDLPPPGFVLVALAFLCVACGAVLGVIQHFREFNVFWITLQKLLLYQGFVLLPILGISPFLLPRFFGMESHHDFPEALAPSREWLIKALTALAAGGLIIVSFWLEAGGWMRLAYAMRFLVTLVYVLRELPLHRAPGSSSALGASLRIAFIGILAGFLATALFPAYRVGLIHLTLIGGFAVITFVVATRVVFGHSGNLARLQDRNRWLWVAVGLMLSGMATRISGDFWPRIMATHYNYGAIIWIAGVLIWAAYVLPKVMELDSE